MDMEDRLTGLGARVEHEPEPAVDALGLRHIARRREECGGECGVGGRELAVSILDGEVLPVVEAAPTESATYDFEARYEVGGATFTCPARLSPEDEESVRETALAAYEALGCSEFSRVDLILGEEGPSVLEVNAIPGLTETSLLPQAAEAAGIGFDALIERLLDMAVEKA